MGHIKNILIECNGDIDQAEKRIKEIAYEREQERKNLVQKLDIAMQDDKKRCMIAKHLAHIIHLITKD